MMRREAPQQVAFPGAEAPCPAIGTLTEGALPERPSLSLMEGGTEQERLVDESADATGQ